MPIVLSGVAAIALHLYDDNSPSAQRRVRHLVRTGFLPAKKVHGRVESRPEWLASVYSEPDHMAAPPKPAAQPPTNGGGGRNIGACAAPGCTERIIHRRGRPPKFCEAHRERRSRTPT